VLLGLSAIAGIGIFYRRQIGSFFRSEIHGLRVVVDQIPPLFLLQCTSEVHFLARQVRNGS
jgi:hypothetical protein